MPKSNIAIIWTPLFECYVVRCESKNGDHIDICLIEIGLRAQNLQVMLGSMVNMIVDLT